MDYIWNKIEEGFACRNWSKVSAAFIPLMVTVRFRGKGEPDWSWNLAEGRLPHSQLKRGCGYGSTFHHCEGSEEINHRKQYDIPLLACSINVNLRHSKSHKWPKMPFQMRKGPNSSRLWQTVKESSSRMIWSLLCRAPGPEIWHIKPNFPFAKFSHLYLNKLTCPLLLLQHLFVCQNDWCLI